MGSSDVTDHRDELARRVETIERGYEYLLAFAAQGRKDDVGSEVRATLLAMQAAIGNLSDVVGAEARSTTAFLETLADDARKAGGVIAFVLSCPAISSLLIDNLNASSHVRALLTDLFLADQALRPR